MKLHGPGQSMYSFTHVQFYLVFYTEPKQTKLCQILLTLDSKSCPKSKDNFPLYNIIHIMSGHEVA